jgi:hypothetical protein
MLSQHPEGFYLYAWCGCDPAYDQFNSIKYDVNYSYTVTIESLDAQGFYVSRNNQYIPPYLAMWNHNYYYNPSKLQGYTYSPTTLRTTWSITYSGSWPKLPSGINLRNNDLAVDFPPEVTTAASQRYRITGTYYADDLVSLDNSHHKPIFKIMLNCFIQNYIPGGYYGDWANYSTTWFSPSGDSDWDSGNEIINTGTNSWTYTGDTHTIKWEGLISNNIILEFG